MNRCSLCQQPKDDSDFAALVVEYHGNEPEPDATSLCQECRALHRLMQREQTAKLLQTAVVQSMDRASLGAVLRHKLRLLLDRATNDELGEFGEAILNRDLTAISRIGSMVAAIVMRGAS
jgi:hypothetical protein